MRIIPFFTSIWQFDLENNFKEEIDKSLEIEQTIKSAKLSNKNGYQSPSFYADSIQLLFPNLFEKIKNSITEVVKDLNISLSLSALWVNINRKHSYNTIHTHPLNLLSGVLYLQTSDNCGDIVFENPTMSKDYPIDDLHPMFYGTYKYTPKPGMFLLFPAYLPHSVDQNLNDIPRISLAMNFNKA